MKIWRKEGKVKRGIERKKEDIESYAKKERKGKRKVYEGGGKKEEKDNK